MKHRARAIPVLRRPDLRVDPEAYFGSRLVTAEKAVSHVKSGDRVAICRGREPQLLGEALAARAGELRGVRVSIPQPGRPFSWYAGPEMRESFQVSVGFVSQVVREHVQAGFVDYRVNIDFTESHPHYGCNPSYGADAYLLEVSPPDEHGFCSFGSAVWDKPFAVRSAKLVCAEVNPRFIRTGGENFVHVSEIDWFVENPRPASWKISRTPKTEMPQLAKPIAEQVSRLVEDGDTIQLGAGSITEWIPRAGAFDDHVDLGLHTEITPRGITRLVQGGVITNRKKSIHTGHCISTAAGGSREDVQFIDRNPLFELYNAEYVLSPLVLAKNRNFVAINQALAIDLSGQSTAESLGGLQWSGPGGQPPIAMGALMSEGGRSILVLPSTSNDGRHSRIVPALPEGTSVTIPRYLADVVVTEYGIARLRWATLQERADALIAIAHPNFRQELRRRSASLAD